ncbi:MAG: hypothetical protein KA354_19755 [Phycisphaerae bacterium]|nr:hypothetical protein [Phycisphaerae bacterium]
MTKGFDTVNLSQLVEVWESYTGWYWFITEIVDDELAFGLVRGFETEWGYISRQELAELADEGKVWRVPRRNWPLCPCVVDANGGSGFSSSHAHKLKGGVR